MNTKDFIRELTNVEEQYKNKPTLTFEVNISSMARDCRKHIEFLNGQIEKMKNCLNCKNELEPGYCQNCDRPYKAKPVKDNWELAE